MVRTNTGLHADRHGGMLASRASTCPRDHFCRNSMPGSWALAGAIPRTSKKRNVLQAAAIANSRTSFGRVL